MLAHRKHSRRGFSSENGSLSIHSGKLSSIDPCDDKTVVLGLALALALALALKLRPRP